jgi:glyoxylate reductase
VTLDQLLERSDVISLMCPLTPQTHHLIGVAGKILTTMKVANAADGSVIRAEFEKMKQDVILVNTARGAVVDENAMVHALNRGKGMSQSKEMRRRS